MCVCVECVNVVRMGFPVDKENEGQRMGLEKLLFCVRVFSSLFFFSFFLKK